MIGSAVFVAVFVLEDALSPDFDWLSQPVSEHSSGPHVLVGAVAFALMPTSCFVFYRRFREDPEWRAFAGGTLAACVAIVVAIVLMKSAQLEMISGVLGVFQRFALVAYFGWVFALALKISQMKQSCAETRPPRSR